MNRLTRDLAPLLFPFAVALVVTLSACGGDDPGPADAPSSTDAAATGQSSATASPEGPLVVFLGDSLTAGYGLSEAQAFPALVERELEEDGVALRVVNAGVSGDTTAGGLARLDWVLRQEPDVLVVGLGGNDGLRGLPLADTKENLRQIVTRAQEAGAEVLLLGMRIPPNLGRDYIEDFRDMYPEIADDLDVALMPFLLENVAARRSLNLPDGIHPNAQGQQVVAENLAPYLEEVLEDLP